jgi:hypothetical protein
MPNLFIEIKGRVVLVVHNGLTYTLEEWQSILALAARPDLNDLRVLVHGEAGSIDCAQRAELIAAMGGRMPTAAVFTANRISRGAATAVAWFKPGIKVFLPDDFEKGASYLGLTEMERAFARGTVARLQLQLASKTG